MKRWGIEYRSVFGEEWKLGPRRYWTSIGAGLVAAQVQFEVPGAVCRVVKIG